MITCDPNALAAAASCLDCSLTSYQLQIARLVTLCKLAEATSGGGGMIAIPSILQWNWVYQGGGVVLASIVGGSCPVGADGFQLGAVASPGDPKSNIIGISPCGLSINATFNIGDTALGAIRWTLAGVAVSGWSLTKSVPVTLDKVVAEYIADLAVLRAGPQPGIPVLDSTTVNALDVFVRGCKTDGIWTNMIEVNCVLRIAGGVDNLFLAGCPLILGPQGAPVQTREWLMLFNESNLTANGLIGVIANSTRAQTNFQPSVSFKSSTNAGVSVYVSATSASAVFEVGAFGTGGGGACFNLSTNFSDVKVRFDCWANNTVDGETQAPSPNLSGFYSCSRISATDARVFFGNSGNAFAQIGVTNANVLTGTAVSCNQALRVWCTTSAAATDISFTDRRLSFVAFHDGLTFSQTQFLFNRVQALRVALGGGFA